jgi:hypothetical protein
MFLKNVKSKKIRKNYFLLASRRSLRKRAGSRAGSVCQRCGSGSVPKPHGFGTLEERLRENLIRRTLIFAYVYCILLHEENHLAENTAPWMSQSCCVAGSGFSERFGPVSLGSIPPLTLMALLQPLDQCVGGGGARQEEQL